MPDKGKSPSPSSDIRRLRQTIPLCPFRFASLKGVKGRKKFFVALYARFLALGNRGKRRKTLISSLDCRVMPYGHGSPLHIFAVIQFFPYRAPRKITDFAGISLTA